MPSAGSKTSSTSQPKLKVVNPFTSLASFPSNICMHDQNGDEYVLLFVRQHIVILLINISIYMIVFFGPWILQAILIYIDNSVFGGVLQIQKTFDIYRNGWNIIILCWIIYCMTGLFNIFFKWFFNINILTNQRFVDFDFVGIFDTRAESAAVTDIEDIKDAQTNVIQSIFNMGDLTVLTASGGTIFSLEDVPRAHQIRDFMMDVTLKVKRMQNNNGDE